jgi:hypothetical protein
MPLNAANEREKQATATKEQRKNDKLTGIDTPLIADETMAIPMRTYSPFWYCQTRFIGTGFGTTSPGNRPRGDFASSTAGKEAAKHTKHVLPVKSSHANEPSITFLSRRVLRHDWVLQRQRSLSGLGFCSRFILRCGRHFVSLHWHFLHL